MSVDQYTVAELEEFGLKIRTIDLLENNLGIITLKQLLAYTREELCNVANIGEVTIDQIIAAVQQHRAKYGW